MLQESGGQGEAVDEDDERERVPDGKAGACVRKEPVQGADARAAHFKVKHPAWQEAGQLVRFHDESHHQNRAGAELAPLEHLLE